MSTKTTYKQTELGLIPEDWEVKKFNKFSKFYSGGTPLTSKSEYYGGEIPFIKSGEIYYDRTEQFLTQEGLNNSSAKLVYRGDLLYALYGANSGEVAISQLEGAINQAILCIQQNKDEAETIYLYNYLKLEKSNIINKFLQGGQGNLSADIIKNLQIPLPPLPEQKKIADCLSTWDVAIEKQSALINALTDRKKALMQQLLTGKKRLPGFSEEWKEVSFEKLLKQIKRKEEWDDKKLYKLLSVKRRSEGIFDREHLFGYQIAVKELMKVKKDDFLISKMQIVHGASALVNDYFENYYVSGSYIVLNIRDKRILNPEFLNYYSKQKLFYYQTYLSSYGVHIEKMTFDFKTFLKIEMTIPSLEEQTAIAEILATADRELQLQKDKLAQLQSQKKGLMQVLLTGKKRLIN
jgi:type I restriction enzyme S subunit